MATIRQYLLRSSGVVLFLLLWELGPRLDWIDPYFVPAFSTVLAEIAELARNGWLQIHLLVSVWRGTTGLLLALLLALPLGYLLGRLYPALAAALDPLLRVLSQVNPFTLLPVFVLFFGIGETAKVAVVAWVALWPVLFYTITAARQVDPLQIKNAAALGVSEGGLLWQVIIPGSLPTVFVGLRIAANLTFFILVAAEMLGAGAGLGWLVHNAAMNYLIPRIYAGALCIVLIGYLLNRLLLALERHLFAWQEDPSTIFIANQHRPVWRPGRAAALCGGVSLATLLILGGWQVQQINRAAANGPGEGSHARHFGTPVESGGTSF